jgi:hypothetical protein
MDPDTVTSTFLGHLAARNRVRFDLEGIDALDAGVLADQGSIVTQRPHSGLIPAAFSALRWTA